MDYNDDYPIEDWNENSLPPKRSPAVRRLARRTYNDVPARTGRQKPDTGKLINSFAEPLSPPLSKKQEAGLQRIPKASAIPSTQEKGGSQLQLLNHYRRNVLDQARQSFLLALIAAAIGLLFYIAAVSFLVLRQPANISITSLISGSLVELISAINFYLYGRASRQLDSFHMYLDRTCRFLTSEQACDEIKDQRLRDRILSDLILSFMEIHQSDIDNAEKLDDKYT
jgi:hypothetical protein